MPDDLRQRLDAQSAAEAAADRIREAETGIETLKIQLAAVEASFTAIRSCCEVTDEDQSRWLDPEMNGIADGFRDAIDTLQEVKENP